MVNLALANEYRLPLIGGVTDSVLASAAFDSSYNRHDVTASSTEPVEALL